MPNALNKLAGAKGVTSRVLGIAQMFSLVNDTEGVHCAPAIASEAERQVSEEEQIVMVRRSGARCTPAQGTTINDFVSPIVSYRETVAGRVR